METSDFLEFIRLVIAGDTDSVSRRLSSAPGLATTASPVGATRQQATYFFFTAISHYWYAGDTALHMAAAASSRPMAELLMTHGADCRARNRRGGGAPPFTGGGGRRGARGRKPASSSTSFRWAPIPTRWTSRVWRHCTGRSGRARWRLSGR